MFHAKHSMRCFAVTKAAKSYLFQHASITTEAMRLNTPLQSADPELYSAIEKEKQRLKSTVCLIPSENFAPRYVMDALGSVMMNKYSEGYPGKRYYGGNQNIDVVEALCQKRALHAFKLSDKEWAANVQPLSGSPANFEVYTALLEPHDRIMSLDLPHGGHLSHGFHTPTKKVSAVAKYFDVLPYRLDEKTGLIDYDQMEFLAERYRPKLLIAGTSAYSRHIDYKKFRDVADKVGAILMGDMAHISGLVAAGVVPSPFEFCDVVTTTTHKSLRGPRGAIIFSRIGQKTVDKAGKPVLYNLSDRINESVFPGHQGGPHNHTIAALAASLHQATTPEFKEYQAQVLANSKAMSNELQRRGYDIVSGGTDNHLSVVDLRKKKFSGAKAQWLCEQVSITINKNSIPSDKSAMNPSGIRIGTPAMTSRGLVEADFEHIAALIDRAVSFGATAQKECGPKVAEFQTHVTEKQPQEVLQLKADVEAFANAFPTVGF